MKVSRAILYDLPNICILVNNAYRGEEAKKGWSFESDLIEGDNTMFEREPLEKVVEMNELMAFKHDSFWQCMDTKRDKDILEEMWLSNKSPWLK